MVMCMAKVTPVRSERMSDITRPDGVLVGKGPSVSEFVDVQEAVVPTVKLDVVITVTPPTVTAIGPEVAFEGTVTIS